ncbi:hypothetical protein RHMOL_Rhmol02G0155100 [Rhododendron molle]|uniref:Uncharacterized protein n=1 Tax=Rhododendron molle TaxID=49168 RepID=A0ACC0PS70_RHOML|nr:hypothetical protein RHMOL_Rhmol02G0155100 [Rhododendron molle]
MMAKIKIRINVIRVQDDWAFGGEGGSPDSRAMMLELVAVNDPFIFRWVQEDWAFGGKGGSPDSRAMTLELVAVNDLFISTDCMYMVTMSPNINGAMSDSTSQPQSQPSLPENSIYTSPTGVQSRSPSSGTATKLQQAIFEEAEERATRYSPPNSTHKPFDLCPSSLDLEFPSLSNAETKRGSSFREPIPIASSSGFGAHSPKSYANPSPSRTHQQVIFEQGLILEAEERAAVQRQGQPHEVSSSNLKPRTLFNARGIPYLEDVLDDSEVELENVLVGIVSSTHVLGLQAPPSPVLQQVLKEDSDDSEAELLEVLEGVVSSVINDSSNSQMVTTPPTSNAHNPNVNTPSKQSNKAAHKDSKAAWSDSKFSQQTQKSDGDEKEPPDLLHQSDVKLLLGDSKELLRATQVSKEDTYKWWFHSTRTVMAGLASEFSLPSDFITATAAIIEAVIIEDCYYMPNQQGMSLGSPFAEGDVLCMVLLDFCYSLVLW